MLAPPTKRICRPLKKQDSILNLLTKRELDANTPIVLSDVPQAAFRLPIVWRKRLVDPGIRNKIFASQWITNNHIVYGTKCNQLVLYDCSNNSSLEIPLINSEKTSNERLPPCVCGIHAIQTNPSRTLLATGGANVNHVGVYSLTDFSPHCLLKNCHTDGVFDARWLDDAYLASCSRDSSLALWRIPAPDEKFLQSAFSSNYASYKAKSVVSVDGPVSRVISPIPDDRFRAMEHLSHFNFLTVVSMSRRLYLYDAVRLGSGSNAKPIFTLALREAYQEAVALRRWPSNPNCVALATHHCVILFDIRCSDPVGATGCCVHPPPAVSGVRSLNFSGDLLSYGSSNGQVHFYDLRGGQHLPVHLEIGPGWVKPNACLNDSEELASLLARSGPPSGLPAGLEPPLPTPGMTVFLPSFNTARFNNIRVRSDRSQFRISDLRSRRFASLIYSMARLREANESNPPNVISSRRRTFATRELEDQVTEPLPSIADSSESEHDDSIEEERFPPIPVSMQSLSSVRSVLWSLPPLNIQRVQAAINFPLVELLSDFSSAASTAHRRLVAIYTHEYDPSGTRLFTAGGPIASTCHGNAAALWE